MTLISKCVMAEEESTENSSQFNLSFVPEIQTPIQFKLKCLNCRKFQPNFYCEHCICKGEFKSSSPEDTETFLEKERKYLKVQKEKENAAAMCRKILERREPNEDLPREIRDCSERIRTLKYLIQEKRESLKMAKDDLVARREKNKTRELRLPRYRERVEKLATYVKRNMRSEINERQDKLNKAKATLKTVVRQNIEYLVRFVFPIVKINPTSKSSDDDEDSDVVSALAEATKTSFVRGTWVLMDSSGELQHQIVAPTLPGSGDYSAYLAAVDTQGGVPITEKIGSNEAYNIGAALCYTTQLVNLLAFYLDVILPKKVTYADFCLRELTDKQFRRKVARLNSNVLFLCFSQGMDSVLLNPKHTLNNVLLLVQHADLGKCGPFHVDSGLILSLECEDADLRGDEGSEEEEGDQLPWEWEAIPLVPCPEGAAGSTMTNTQATTSIAGGLVTSLASMFRGWSGNK